MNVNYYTIGEFSKISGVNIKSLRYYNKIEVLIPDYTNPDTGYRYYSYNQLRELNLIQFCIAMNVPLKTYKDYIKNGLLDYEEFLNYCKDIAYRNFLKSKRNIQFVDYEFEGISLLRQHGIRRVYERNYHSKRMLALYPIKQADKQESYTKALSYIQSVIHKEDWITFFDNGILELYEQDTWNHYAYCEVFTENFEHDSRIRIIQVPAESVVCIMDSYDALDKHKDSLSIRPNAYLKHELCVDTIDLEHAVWELQAFSL